MEVGGVTYCLAHPASSEALIDEQDFERDERLPYWAELWPSALALARRAAARNLSTERAIELGCGVGLPSIVALARGADALATDHYQAALDFAAHNARTNLDKELKIGHLDWHEPPEGLPQFDLVLAADVLYERRNVPALARLIPELLVPDGGVLLADPRRTYAEEFLKAMGRRGFQGSTESALVEQEGREVEVLIHQLERRSQ